jgi:hypothetical protein
MEIGVFKNRDTLFDTPFLKKTGEEPEELSHF